MCLEGGSEPAERSPGRELIPGIAPVSGVRRATIPV